ncbi:glycosyltransferase [Paenibacillus beijingensis]|uniref:Dolichyl-phosphate beta-D-mannosyltransferase n=1 Tax=Paenibacillus beijingensis TaxID=1126833 RepID=A0A0D5NH70_9BACL|nr:glycosyltransferase family 2 protein [Paenibacillus beijingensis]AJY74606.1 hypothetical protein VN24_08485 [Paenibacillus beijingensis]
MELSIIIPSFNERENVKIISGRIIESLKNQDCAYEILFVDDSKDDTPIILEQLSKEHSQVRYIHRENGRGLGTAVVEGFNKSIGKKIIVMDSDLQHPPELIPLIFQRLKEGTDLIIPSRFVPGGSDGGLNTFRKFVSWTARTIGRISLKRMRNITDCTGGYFGLNRSILHNAQLDPIGWKILMEILVKCEYKTVHEIPYSFVSRHAGESKMSMKEQWNYLKHIAKLIWNSDEDRRFYLFCAIGALGVGVNLISLYILVNFLGLGDLRSSIIASFIAMVNNYLWNDNLTWKKYKKKSLKRRFFQFPKFLIVSVVGIGITALLAQTASWLDLNIFFGQFAGIVAATLWNFKANSLWTWSNKDTNESREKTKVIVSQEPVQLSKQAV